MKKSILKIALAAVLSLSISLTAFAHPGRTDSNGGHNKTSDGTYHYHHGDDRTIEYSTPQNTTQSQTTVSPTPTTETNKDVAITYRDIKVSVGGKELVFTNLEGETLEPFIAFSTVYVSASAAARALGKNAAFDSTNNMLKINGTATAIPIKKATAGTTTTKKTNVTYKNIRIFLDGKEVTLTDMEGNKQEPFIAFNTVYVPLTALAKALGKTTSVNMAEAPTKPSETIEKLTPDSATESQIYFYQENQSVPDFGKIFGIPVIKSTTSEILAMYLYDAKLIDSMFDYPGSVFGDLLRDEGFVFDDFSMIGGAIYAVYIKSNILVYISFGTDEVTVAFTL